MSLGEKIQQLRKAGGLSQEQLADSLMVSRQAVSKWETDQSSPDIENILALSRFFSISTDELLGNDVCRNTSAPSPQPVEEREKQSSGCFSWIRKFNGVNLIRRFIGFIDCKIIFMLFTLMCFLAAGICVIVNYAIEGRLTWAAYPIISLVPGWLIITPLIFRKYTLSLCVLTAVAAPFLYLMNIITPEPDWFYGLGLPVTAVSAVFLWVIYLLFRFVKISVWYKAAISCLLGGVVVNPLINYLTDSFLKMEISVLELSINLFSYLAASVVFWIAGYMRKKAKAAGDNAKPD